MQKNRLLNLLSIIFIILLLLAPVRIAAEISNDHGAASIEQDWPSIIQELETANIKNPNNPGIVDSLANAYNNYGLILAEQKQWQSAISYLQDAVNTKPSSVAIKKNLSAIYFSYAYESYLNYPETNYSSYRYAQAKQLCTQALALNPNNINALILLGDIEYINQNLDAALNTWKRGAKIELDNPAINDRITRITREANAEANMNTKYNMYFIIKVDPKVEKLAGFDINETLDSLRRDISRDLNYQQNIKIPVIVYTSQSYKDSIPDAPDWSEGAFDGKIRIVLTPYKNNISLLKSTIAHEYTHAVIMDLTHGNIPRWFNEGIAKYMEYKYGIPPRVNYLAHALTSDNIIPWDQIDTAIISPNKNMAMLAYQQSFNFVFYLVQRYGMTKLRTLLDMLGATVDFQTAIERTYGVPLATIQRNWSLWLPEFINQWAEAPIRAVQ